MGKEQRRNFLWPWVYGILLLLMTNYGYVDVSPIYGGLFLTINILVSIRAIRKQYKRAQRMDGICWLMIVLAVLFTILGTVIISYWS